MTVEIKHPFTSSKSDGSDSSQVQPSHWNSNHYLNLNGPALIGLASSYAGGAAVEIQLGEGLSFVGNTLVGSAGVASFPELTDKPTTVAGYGITDAYDGNFEDLSGTPTTIAGYGITDAFDGTYAALSGVPLLHDIAISGSYEDLEDVPAFDAVALSGEYGDLKNPPVIPSLTGYALETYVTDTITALIDSSPEALNTLKELATALGDDAEFSTTVTNSLATKVATADLDGLVRTYVVSQLPSMMSELESTLTVSTALAKAHSEHLLKINSTLAITVTVTTDLDGGWSGCESISFYQASTGDFAVAAAPGVTIHGVPPSGGQFSIFGIVRVAINEWTYV